MSEYEFSEDENVIIETLAERMSLVGLLMAGWFLILLIKIAANAFSSSDFEISEPIDALDSILFIVLGITFYRSTDNLKWIATTEGNDISELMTAFGEISDGLRVVMILLALHFILILYPFFF